MLSKLKGWLLSKTHTTTESDVNWMKPSKRPQVFKVNEELSDLENIENYLFGE